MINFLGTSKSCQGKAAIETHLPVKRINRIELIAGPKRELLVADAKKMPYIKRKGWMPMM